MTASGSDPLHSSNQNQLGRSFSHEPVMLKEVLDTFASLREGLFVDATVGGGGHAEALLTDSANRNLLGLDRDLAAVLATRKRLRDFDNRIEIVHCRFDEISGLSQLAEVELSGALFDLGLSSHQLDTADRGFSYRLDSDLDMRMDTSAALDAYQVVNNYSERELASIIRAYSDERFAGRIAAAIISQRPISSTLELADVVRGAVPAAARRTGRHPAMRTFQAIRIEVNSELDLIKPALNQIIERLRPGGRIVVLSYHSGEDRIVKQVLREAADGLCVCPSTLPCICGSEPNVKLLRRKVTRPSTDEVNRNPRAASARFRAAERLSAGEA